MWYVTSAVRAVVSMISPTTSNSAMATEQPEKAIKAIRTRQINLHDIIVGSGAETVIRACEEKGLITSSVLATLVDSWTGKSESSRAYSLLDTVRNQFVLNTDVQLNRFLSVLRKKCGENGKIISQEIAQECKEIKCWRST